jgi:predicted small lipoprotein YifL
MKISKVSVLILMVVLAFTASVSACGRKGVPVLPKGEPQDTYPDQYPRSTKPQSGVFSG